MADGELGELFEDFSEGRVQFGFVKVKDPNSGLPKHVLIAWCGGGVPERTKGYFTSHLNAVSKVLHGYHVQITARSADDLDPDALMRKVSDASGSKYAGGPAADAARAPPPIKFKPVFSPSNMSAGRSLNPLVAARSRKDENVDDDGWGADAPPVTRTQVERVESAYKPTKVDMPGLSRQSEPSRYTPAASHQQDGDVIGGGYKPVGKVDIAAIRAQAKEQRDDRPTPVKGSYEPVGKVDIAAIRAKAHKPASEQPEPEQLAEDEAPKPLADRAAAFSQPAQSERLTSLPKPKVANKFGAGGFATKAPTPGALGLQGPVANASTAPVTTTSRTFANEGGKTPAQLWAEKKARESGAGAGAREAPPSSPPPINQQQSGNNEWKSGYAGKSWAAVQTPAFGRGGAETVRGNDQAAPEDEQAHGDQKDSTGGVSALRDRFKGATPVSGAPPVPGAASGHGDEEEEEEPAAPPPPPAGSRPPGGFALPGLPTRPPPVDDDEEEEEEEEPEREQSPIRVAQPVARAAEPVRAPAPPPAPVSVPREPTPGPEPESEPEPEPEHAPAPPPAPAAHQAAPPPPAPAAGGASQRAVILYDYDKDEDNEINLVEGETVTDIDQVDPDWWIGTNVHGENGLFPSSYVELIKDNGAGAGVGAAAPPPPAAPGPAAASAPTPAPAAPAPAAASSGHTATALYDYEAAEDNGMQPFRFQKRATDY